MQVHVTRHCSYWVLNVIMPMAIITCATFASYIVPPTDLADRCSVTLTMLLAQVAYKYLVGEKLPNLGYATLIDFYVLLCFVITFVILVQQCFSAIGLYTEPTFDAVVTEGGATRTVPVPTLFVGLFAGWIGLHALIFLLLPALRAYDRWRDPFWSSGRRTERALWVGPVAIGLKDGGDRTERLKELESTVFDFLAEQCDARGCRRPKRVLLWPASDAERTMESSGFGLPYKLTSDFVVAIMPSAEDGEMLHGAWKGDDAPEWTAEKKGTGDRRGSRVDGVMELMPQERVSLERKATGVRALKIESLDSVWAPLTTRRTFERGAVLSGAKPKNRVMPDGGAPSSDVPLPVGSAGSASGNET